MPTVHIEPATPARAPDRATVFLVASKIPCDPRTALKVLLHGPDAVRTLTIRERARLVLAELHAA